MCLVLWRLDAPEKDEAGEEGKWGSTLLRGQERGIGRNIHGGETRKGGI